MQCNDRDIEASTDLFKGGEGGGGGGGIGRGGSTYIFRLIKFGEEGEPRPRASYSTCSNVLCMTIVFFLC